MLMKLTPGNLLKARSSIPVEFDLIHCRDVGIGKDLENIEEINLLIFGLKLSHIQILEVINNFK